MSTRNLGILQIILSGVCFGFLGLFGKILYERGVVPGELLTLRFLIAALLTFVLLLVTSPKLFRLKTRDVIACAGLGIFGYALFSFCFFSALKGLSASLTVLLLYTYPVIVAFLGYVFLKESISRKQLLAFPLAAFGLLGLVWGDFAMERAVYLLFGISAAIFYAIYILVSAHYLKGVDTRIATPLIQIFAALVLGSLYLRDIDRATEIVSESWLVLIGVAVICSIAAMGLFLAGLKKLKGWEVSLLSTTEPLTGVAVAAIFLGEKLTLVQFVSALMVVFALIWVTIAPLFEAKQG